MNHSQDKGYSRPSAKSRERRRRATEAERKLSGVRFNRQFPIRQQICDFVSRKYRLVIEIDGGQHAHARKNDESRTRFLEAQGYQVIRFWNKDVMDSLEGVLARIGAILADRPSPAPSRRREGS